MLLKSIFAILLILFGLLEYSFWFGPDNIIKTVALKKTLVAKQKEFAELEMRNRQLATKVENLKSDPIVLEEQARYELGMVRKGEKYYQVVEPIE